MARALALWDEVEKIWIEDCRSGWSLMNLAQLDVEQAHCLLAPD
jgi:hypothetical protein